MEQQSDPKVSGTVILDQIALMKRLYGASLVERAARALPPELGQELAELLPGRWCSLDAARELKALVATEVGLDPLALQRAMVRAGIEQTLSTIWRFVLRQLGDEGLARRTPVVYSRTFNRGSLELMAMGDCECHFELRGWPRIPEYELVGLMTGIETILALAGRQRPQVTATRRPAVVKLHAKWMP
jgi:hypothetical protein